MRRSCTSCSRPRRSHDIREASSLLRQSKRRDPLAASNRSRRRSEGADRIDFDPKVIASPRYFVALLGNPVSLGTLAGSPVATTGRVGTISRNSFAKSDGRSIAAQRRTDISARSFEVLKRSPRTRRARGFPDPDPRTSHSSELARLADDSTIDGATTRQSGGRMRPNGYRTVRRIAADCLASTSLTGGADGDSCRWPRPALDENRKLLSVRDLHESD